MNSFNSERILERMKTLTKAKSDKELADLLTVKATTFSGWKKNNTIPLETLINFANFHGVSMDWLLFGKEIEELSQNEKIMLFAYNSLSESKKLELMGMMMGLGIEKTDTKVDQSNNQGGTNNYIAGNYAINQNNRGN